MSHSAVRKSGRIKSGKKTSHMSNDYEYDEKKFDPNDETNFEIQTESNVDISTNISDLLHSHSKETGNEYENFNNSCDVFIHNSEESIVGNQAGGLTESQILTCDICGKILSDNPSYDRHMKSHSSARQFLCGQCEKSFPDSCSLKRHMKTHEDDRPFSCEICHKSFRDTASISRHMLTHTERPRTFQCSMCDKNFTDKAGLKRHERTHTGIRPFVCEVCQKSFIDSCSFKRHKKIHIGIKNFHCQKCNRSFMEKQSLIRHQKTVCKFFDNSYDTEQEGINGVGDISLHQADNQSNNISNINTFNVGSEDKILVNHRSDNNTNSLSSSVSQSLPGLNHVMPNDFLVTSEPTQNSKSSMKGQPSLGSLIQRDPGLYDSISEIVESIDSYEKMLDLCGDQGQKEIDAALTRDPIPMPNNLLCFECGELLVEDENFKSEGKIFHPSMTNAFKCLNCMADDDDEEFGEPPVLMPHYGGINGVSLEDEQTINQDKSTENIYGTDESIEQFQDRLKKDHGVYFADSCDFYQADDINNGNNDRTDALEFNSVSNFTPPKIRDEGISNANSKSTENQNSLKQEQLQQTKKASISVNNTMAISLQQMGEKIESDQTKLDYEAEDSTIPSVFPCHLCTKVFASSLFLAQHLSLHKMSPHKCTVCSKSFTSAPALKRHARLHTGEMPYTCPICLKQFRDPSNFGKHKKGCVRAAVTNIVPVLDTDCTPNPKRNQTWSNELNRSSVPCIENGKIELVVENVHKRGGKDKRRGRKKEVKRKISNNFPKGSVNVGMTDSCMNHESEGSHGISAIDQNVNPQFMSVMPSLYDDEMEVVPSDEKENGVGTVGQDKIKDEECANKNNYIACDICQKLCESRDHLDMHMNYHNGNPNTTCIECGKTFADSFGLKRHMRTHLGIRPYTCEYCNRGYCDNWTLKKHKSKGCLKTELKVPTDLLHPCPKCEKVFSDEEYLQDHMKVHKGVVHKEYQCDICHKRFSEAFNLKKHRRLHMAICPGCGLEFANIQLLHAHQESDCSCKTPAKDNTNAVEVKSFSCEVCGRAYSTRAYLDRHRKIHSGIKPHACEICNKKFSEAFKLRRHMKTAHSDEKPFACTDCGKCFIDEEALKRHTVSSACALTKVMGDSVGSENCVCQFCDKVFQKNYMLVRHMAVHSQNRPFECEICGRSYKDTSSLKRHQVTHKGIKSFICPTCGTDFYYSDSLKRHMSGKCGRKTKKRRRLVVSWNRPKKRYPKKSSLKNNVVNNNENDIANKSSHFDVRNSSLGGKRRLQTLPYICPIISDPSSKSYCLPENKRLKSNEKWSCHRVGHCWLCDIKAPYPSALTAHRRQVHDVNNKKKFRCPKCFLRLHKKIYWRAHTLSCHLSRTIKPSYTEKGNECTHKKTKRKSTSWKAALNSMDDSYSVKVSETVGGAVDEEFETLFQAVDNGKRPRRSVPRAKWSWISQI